MSPYKKAQPRIRSGRYYGAAPLLNLAPEINDFEDMMAILDALDLLVTVDTTVAHLAGALGRPAFIAIAYAPDWRWLLGRSDTPWYSSVRLFRQTTPGRWDDLMQDIAARAVETLTDLSRTPRAGNTSTQPNSAGPRSR